MSCFTADGEVSQPVVPRRRRKEDRALRREPKWIEFHEWNEPVGRKSRVWLVNAKDQRGTLLGEIKWFGRWRGYAFFPRPETVFEPTCLDDIAAFIRDRMSEHRRERRARP